MKKKMGVRTLAVMLAASVVISTSTGMASAVSGAGVSATGDVSDASTATETTSRSAQKSKNIAIEGSALTTQKIPEGLSGAGTQSNPYMIGSLKEMLLMNQYINYENSNQKCFALSGDIDMSGARFMHFTDCDGIYSLISAKATLSGNANVFFHLDGRGHKLYGMNMSVPNGKTNAAIFGFVNANSTIANLTLENCILRVNHESEGAFALLAVQNQGTIRNVTMKDCVLDLRLANNQSADAPEGSLSGMACGKVYSGYALGVADNAGKVMNFTASGSDTNKGVFVKGTRHYVGVIVGQNRKDITEVRVSGMRIVAYGSEDGNDAVAGKGEVASYIGMIAGKNAGKNSKNVSGCIRSASVSLTNGSDILFGNYVGGIAGDNAGTIAESAVRSSDVASASLYGVGVYGGIAGVNSGSVSSCGVYRVGFSFARSASQNVYGGVVGENSGSVSNCAASGKVSISADAAASVGGVVGCVKAGSSISGNYALVSVSERGANCGAVVGKGGTVAYVGQNNYWSSEASGLLGSVPGASERQGDLTPATAVINVSAGKGAVTLGQAALSMNWAGSKASALPDFSGTFTVSEPAIRIKQSGSSVLLSSNEEGAFGDLKYTVSVPATVGDGSDSISARVSVPVYVTASSGQGAGSSEKNPIVLTSYGQLKMLKYAPDAHYKLGADIIVGADWTLSAFTGTLNGAGHTLYISAPLFSSVTGSRNARVSDNNWKTSDGNLKSGYIHDLKIVPASRVDGSVFGAVKNATLQDVTYAASTEYEDGFVLLSSAKAGALIDTLSGNDYLSRCTVSVSIAVTAAKSEGIGALAGYVAADHLLAEQCAVSSLLALEKNLDKVGGLFGDMSAVRGSAKLVNCTASGCVYVTSSVQDVKARIMIGAAGKSTQAQGCEYSAFTASSGSAATLPAPFTDGIREIPLEQTSDELVLDGAPLILPEVLAEDELVGADFSDLQSYTDNGVTVYKIMSKTDLETMRDLITDVATARSSTFELCADIDMQNSSFRMAQDSSHIFTGTFRGATKPGGGKYTISNFRISNTTTGNYSSATGLFSYAQGAVFDNIAIDSATVSNTGNAVGVLVGIADKASSATSSSGNASQCTFTNIEITNCSVSSSRSSTSTLSFSLTNVSQAGALVGALFSSSTGNIYENKIYNIVVRDTTVQNPNSGYAWAIGGLIGDSRCANGTVCVGKAGTSPSIVLEHVTVRGYGMVGGVIGKAGTAIPKTAIETSNIASTFAATCKGGIKIVNVAVRGNQSGRSSITAGNGSGNGGLCGGILGCEMVGVGNASIADCTVTDTDITSNNPEDNGSNYYTDCGGIAGHMAGTVEDCTVEDCTISSVICGGIVGRSSRKARSAAGTHLEINDCAVLGETVLTAPTNSTNNECGGIVSGGRGSEVVIDGCSVGPDVSIQGDFLYVGGIAGFTSVNDTGYTSMTISDCITYAQIHPTPNSSKASANPAIGGIFGCSSLPYTDKIKISGCVIGGTLDIDTYYAGGVIGTFSNEGVNDNLIKNCTMIASINQGENTSNTAAHTCKMIGRVNAYYDATGWMAYLSSSLPGNIVSSYPQDCTYIGEVGTDPTDPNDIIPFDNFVDNQWYLVDGNPITFTGAVTDINRPTRTKYANGDTFPYIHGFTTAFTIDGSVVCEGDVCAICNNALTPGDASIVYCATCHTPCHASCLTGNGDVCPNAADHGDFTWSSATKTRTCAITNGTSYTTGSPARLTWTSWASTANGTVSVLAASTSSAVKLQGKKTGSAGFEGTYTIGSFTIPGTSDPATIKAKVPVEVTNIAGLTLRGHGLVDDPYLIHNLAELDCMRTYDLSQGKYFAVVNDIDINPNDFTSSGDFYNSGAFFTPIIGKEVDDGNGNMVATVFNGILSGAYVETNNVGVPTANTTHRIRGLKIGDSAANTGLFAQTDGATIEHLTFDDATISSSGDKVGLLVGDANETTFTGITIGTSEHPVTIAGSNSGSVYAGALAAYAVDTATTDTTLTGVSVSGAYFTGGLFGHAHDSDGSSNSILHTTINGLTVTSTSTQSLTDGVYGGRVDIAAGIAAEFSGTLGSTGSANVTTLSGTGTITGSIASGVVGLVDETAGGTCAITNVSISGTYTITSSRSATNSDDSGQPTALTSAAGIVGKVRKDASDTGNATPAVDLDITGCTVSSTVTISAIFYAGGIVGNSGLVNGTIDLSGCKSFAEVKAAVSGNLSYSAIGGLVGCVRGINGLTIDDCVASGTLTSGTTNNTENGGALGGVIGLVDYQIMTKNTAIVSDTVVSVEMGSANKRGVLIGAVAKVNNGQNNVWVLPDSGLTPFTNVYYSSYQLENIDLSGDNAYTDYQATYVDLQTNMKYDDGTASGTKTLPISSAGLTLTTASILLPSCASGNFESFTCTQGVPFVLDSVYAAGGSLFSYNSSTRTFTLNDSGTDDAVFAYTNGLKIAFDVVAMNISGDGTQDRPYLIEEIDHLKMVKADPSAYFILARDLDFTGSDWEWDETEGQNEPEITDDWMHVMTTTPFSGHLDGEWYESYSESNHTNSSVKYGLGDGYYGDMVHHSIQNLSVESAAELVGFFPILAPDAVVQNLVFDSCSFESTAARSGGSEGNAGVLAGMIRPDTTEVVNNETITHSVTLRDIEVGRCTVEANGHAGAIAGVSLTNINNCHVLSGTTVTSAHCAGGIVGGGASASNCTVTGASVTGGEYAGGIIGGTMSFNTSSGDWPSAAYSAQRNALARGTISGCTVSGASIAASLTNKASNVGGILGVAEEGLSGQYRQISITGCTVGSSTTTDTSVTPPTTTTTNTTITTATGTQQNSAAGILGFMQAYHDGLLIRSCESYASVTTYGSSSGNNVAASAIFGALTQSTNYKLYANSTPNFRIINNVAGGTLTSPSWAGGVIGTFRTNLSNNSYKVAAGDFISGNIISCTFRKTENSSTDHFGIFGGYMHANAFTSTSVAATVMDDNYYSSDVSNVGSGMANVAAFPTGSGVTAVGLYNVAARGIADDNSTILKSLQIDNDDGEGYQEILYGIPVSDTYPHSIPTRDTKLQFKKGNATSVDFAALSDNTMVVYSGVDSSEQHTLELTAFSVDPSNSPNYGAAIDTGSERKGVTLTIKQNPRLSSGEKIVADLGYGLLVKNSLSNGSTEDGSIRHPYTIPDAQTFAYYFFGEFAADSTKAYESKHYLQTADISFNDIITAINGLTGTYRRNRFAPIGTETNSFSGGYDGGGYRITDFHYSTNDSTMQLPGDPSVTDDVGLFGYVDNTGVEAQAGDYRLRNIHIELADGTYGLDGTTSTAAAATAASYDLGSVCGGTYTGGLVGRYMSNIPVTNCSVVYGTVRSDQTAGGLIGLMASGTLQNCFTSTNVRVYDTYAGGTTASSWEAYAAGGLVGEQYSVVTDANNPATSFVNCFTSSDVLAPMLASGFIGHININAGGIELTDCYSAATVFARMPVQDDQYTKGPSLMVGHRGDPNYTQTERGVKANNVLIAGLNTTEFSHYVNSNQYYPMLFGTGYLKTGSSNVYYDADVIGRITIPGENSTPYIMRTNGQLRDLSDQNDASESNSGLSGATRRTSQLTTTGFTSLGASWTPTAGLYPVLNMSVTYSAPVNGVPTAFPASIVRKVNNADTPVSDPYFEAFAKLSALPTVLDTREADDVSSERTYAGITYPAYIANTIDGQNISVSASKYSAVASDSYNEYYDYKLVGNPGGGVSGNHSGTDMNTDLLFNKQTQGKTFILRNTYLDFGSSRDDVARNQKAPYVTVSANLYSRGATTYPISRQIRIGLRGSDNTVYVATERQLRALTVKERNTKYEVISDALTGDYSTSKNIRICADIDFLPAPTGGGADHRSTFMPITGYTGTNSGDDVNGAFGFDGSNCVISNLYIDISALSSIEGYTAGPVGLFSSIGAGSPKINNLILRNVDITGNDDTGALVGSINSSSIEISNCMVNGGTVQGRNRTGGMIGTITGTGTVGAATVNQCGVVGVEVIHDTTNVTVQSPCQTGFGVLAGEMTTVTVEDVYTIGKVSANSAAGVGGLVGVGSVVVANGIVTSGYVSNSGGPAGGVIGKLGDNASALRNAESTAYVTGNDVIAGMIGSVSSGSPTVERVIFAGSMGSSTSKSILGSGSASISSAAYDSNLSIAGFNLDETDAANYPGLTTDQIVSGTGTVSDLAMHTSGHGGSFDTSVTYDQGTDNERTVYDWSFDTAQDYYPNPVSVTDIHPEWGAIGHVISDTFKAGLSFALTRIDFAYAGMVGTIHEYTLISAHSPVGSNANDTVELVANGTVTTGDSHPYYLVHPQSALNQLESNAWEANATTPVRAQLNTATGATFETLPSGSVYRYLNVEILRTVQVTYVFEYDTGLTATGANSVGLSLRTLRSGTAVGANAVTSLSQDAANGNTVRFEKILCQDNIYPDTILPKGFKATYSVVTGDNTTSGVTWDSTNKCISISNATGNDTVNVRLKVTVSNDPGWGLRDVTYGKSGSGF